MATILPQRPFAVKLALVTETYPPEINGVAMTLSQLVSGLREKGHEVQVVRPLQNGERGSPSASANQLTVFGLPIPRYPDLRFGLPSRNRLIHAWRENRPHVVHIATEGPLGLSAIRAAKTLGIPCTSTFHTNFHSYSEHYNAKFATRLILAFLRWIHNQTSCTMSPTVELANDLAEAGFKNMEVFGRGVNLNVFNPSLRDPRLRNEWGAGPDDTVVVHVSRLASEKNYQLLRVCYEKIRNQNSNTKFVIVGGGPLEASLRKEFPYAVFTGPIPLEERETLARIYASADVFLYPSKTETYGNVATEAMACGNALVAFDYAAAALHVKPRQNGVLAPLDDDQRFIELSLEVAGNRSFQQKLGQQAALDAKAFEWQPIVDRFEAILNRVTHNEVIRNA